MKKLLGQVNVNGNVIIRVMKIGPKKLPQLKKSLNRILKGRNENKVLSYEILSNGQK
jgi:hypothetical protein